jgi:hypothetical protein
MSSVPARTRFVEKYFDNKSRSRNYEKLVIKWNMEDEFMSIVEDYSIYVDQAVMPTAGKEWHVVQFKARARDSQDLLNNVLRHVCRSRRRNNYS